MQRSELRHTLRQLPARVEQSLPTTRKFYILIAVAFGCVGYLAGVSLLGRFTPAPINLEEPVLPPVEGGANPVLPDTRPTQVPTDSAIKPETPPAPDQPAPELQPSAVPDRSAFTAAENCRIWKRTFPEAAAKLKPGDACY